MESKSVANPASDSAFNDFNHMILCLLLKLVIYTIHIPWILPKVKLKNSEKFKILVENTRKMKKRGSFTLIG
jgi:hypothetical protein